jgi:hypothetical protein
MDGVSTEVPPTVTEGESAGTTDEFVALLRSNPASWDPIDTPGQLAREAKLTILGTVLSAGPGVGYFLQGDSEPTAPTLLLRVRVDKRLAGVLAAKGEIVNILVLHAPVTPVSAFVKAIPRQQRGVFFLYPMTDMFGEDGFAKFPEGLSESSVLYSPHPQGMILENSQTGVLTGAEIRNNEFPRGWDLAGKANDFAERVQTAATTSNGPDTTDG